MNDGIGGLEKSEVFSYGRIRTVLKSSQFSLQPLNSAWLCNSATATLSASNNNNLNNWSRPAASCRGSRFVSCRGRPFARLESKFGKMNRSVARLWENYRISPQKWTRVLHPVSTKGPSCYRILARSSGNLAPCVVHTPQALWYSIVFREWGWMGFQLGGMNRVLSSRFAS